MRHYIGISPSGETVLHNVRKDDTGEPLILIDKDGIKRVRLDFSDWLGSSETISSVSTTAESCAAIATTADTYVDLTLSATTNTDFGRVRITATTSEGDVWVSYIRCRRTARYTDEQKYRDYT